MLPLKNLARKGLKHMVDGHNKPSSYRNGNMYSLLSPTISLNYEFLDIHKKLPDVCSDFIKLVYFIDSMQAKVWSNYAKMATTLEHDARDVIAWPSLADTN